MAPHRFFLLVLTAFLWPLSVWAATITIYPTDDAYISFENPYENYGSISYLSAGADEEGEIRRGYLKFDLPEIPPGKIIGWAQLRLWLDFTTAIPPHVGIHYLPDDSWDEMTITWDNCPKTYNSEPSDIYQLPLTIGHCFWTVTGDVEQEYSGDRTLSMVLKSKYEAVPFRATFRSKERYVQAEKPCLEIEYGDRFAGGDGTEENPYLIAYHYQLNEIGKDPCCWDKHFKLISDIDLSRYKGTQFNIIGKYVSYDNPENEPFTGTFDGDGHIITGFTYDTQTADGIGLFSYVSGESALIKNLGLADPNVQGDDNTAALVGLIEDGTIRGCFVSGGGISGSEVVGGLIGLSDHGRIYESHALTTVQGDSSVGVLIGMDLYSEVVCCYSSGSAVGQTECVGGLIGACSSGVKSHCYSIASAQGNNAVGGLAGEGRNSTFDNCYAAGSVSGIYGTGGLVGAKYSGGPTVYNCFWDYQTTGEYSSVGGGTMLSTSQMQDAANFQAQGWDFDGPSDGPSDLWAMPDTPGYPILWLQQDPLPELPEFSGGLGLENDPYLIGTAADLRSIGYNPRLMHSHFKIINNIDLVGMPFNTIARAQPRIKYFAYKGIFDGDNHTISNLSCPSDKRYQTGLLGYALGETTEIKKLVLSNVDVNAPSWSNVGAIVSALEDARLQDCRIEGVSVVGYQFVGGLVGGNKKGRVHRCRGFGLNISGNRSVGGFAGATTYEEAEIINCSAEGTVSAEQGAAGFVCTNHKGLIKSCYADINVNSSLYGAAGFVADQLGIVRDCYAQGQVSSANWVGGMFAVVDWDAYSINCYTTCQVDGNEYTGGFTGMQRSGNYSGCFWDSDINPDVNGIGDAADPNVTGLPTVLMQTESTFTDAGWDFVGETINGANDIWSILEGLDYPRLFTPSITGWEIAATHGGGLGEIWCPVEEGYIESRVSGISKLRVCFNRPMDTNVTDANEVSILGANSGMQPAPCSIEWDGVDCMIITMSSALPDQDRYNIWIGSGIVSQSGHPIEGNIGICLIALKGDANRSRSVNAQDLLAIRAHAGETIDSSNARYDINCSGGINAQDLLAARQYAGNGAPECSPGG